MSISNNLENAVSDDSGKESKDSNGLYSETQTNIFEISFRLLGNEVVGMKLTSESRIKNWIFIGLITLIALTIVINQIGPDIAAFATVLLGK